MFDTSRPFTFDRVVRILITIATLIGAYWLLKAISGALLPFCVACLPTSSNHSWLSTNGCFAAAATSCQYSSFLSNSSESSPCSAGFSSPASSTRLSPWATCSTTMPHQAAAATFRRLYTTLS